MLVFIYSRMTARSRRGEAAEAGPHIKRWGSAGCEGTAPPPLLRRVFPGPNKPGTVRVAVPNSRAPSHAGGGYWGEQEDAVCHRGVRVWWDVLRWRAFWRCRSARSWCRHAPGLAFPHLSRHGDAPQALRSLLWLFSG